MEEQKQITGYGLSRSWFDFCFDNPEKIKPIHTAIFVFAIEHNNRLGWREKFGLPSEMVMSALGIKNWRTYTKALKELEEFGFIVFLERSKNQYSSNIITLFAYVKNTKALDRAIGKASAKHSTKQGRGTVSVDKLKELKEPSNRGVKKFTPPTVEEIKNYAIERGYEVDAEKIFNHYDVADWKDVNGKQVKNWKQKISTIWFKPEYKVKNYETMPFDELVKIAVSMSWTDRREKIQPFISEEKYDRLKFNF